MFPARMTNRLVAPAATLSSRSTTINNAARRWMAGHNKWSKIHRKKAKNDRARAAAQSKATKAIIAATKACGGDLSNLHLQSCIAHAKSVELPKTKIQDAIDRCLGKEVDEQAAEYVRYDAMVTCGGRKVATVIAALTDNRKRTAAQVRASVTRMGGEVLPTEKLGFFFRRRGVALVDDVSDEEALFEAAIEAGATDVEFDSGSAMITTDADDLWQVVSKLREKGCTVDEFEHRYLLNDPEMAVEVGDGGMEELETFLTAMEENEDVTQVYHNAAME